MFKWRLPASPEIRVQVGVGCMVPLSMMAMLAAVLVRLRR